MNNIEYIRNWFLTNNEYLNESPNKDEIIHILTLLAVAFAKVDEIPNEDEIVLKEGIILFNAGKVKESAEMNNLLKIINFNYGYLEYDDLSQIPEYAKLKYLDGDGVLTLEQIIDYFDTTYDNLMVEYKNYDFDKVVYKTNGKVFFCDRNLEEKELEQLYSINDDEQKLFEVYHDDDDIMRIY